MKIKCDPLLLNNAEDKILFFSGMLSHRESHTLEISNIEELIRSDSLNETEKEYLRRLTVASSYKNYDLEVTISISDELDNTFKASQLNDILSRKAIIILENEFSDAAFIEAVLKSQDKEHLIDVRDISWEIKGAGGCGEIPKHIISESKKMKSLKRIIVVHDSDRMFPTSTINDIQQKIIDTANAHGVTCCTLEKREIENYIPDKLISSVDDARKNIVSHFKSLTVNQKDHYDYKYGFKKKGGYKKRDDTAFNGLYDDLSDEVYDSIKNGFGKDIAELVYKKDTKISKHDFAARCGRINAEFNIICEAIERIL